MSRKRLLLFFSLFISSLLFSQVTPEKIKNFVLSDQALKSTGIVCTDELKEYYQNQGYQPSWMSETGEYCRNTLVKLLQSAEKQGLDENDYQHKFIHGFSAETISLTASNDSVAAEIRFSDAALHFFHDMVYGNTRPSLGYEGLSYTPGCFDIAGMLAQYYKDNQLCLLFKWQSPFREVRSIHQRLVTLQDNMILHPYREAKIVSTITNSSNKALVEKLYYLGISDSLDMRSEAGIKEKIKEAQRQFNLPVDGTLKGAILKELNVPVTSRIEQLKLSLNYYRWLYCLTKQQPVIVVNIPAARLNVYGPAGVILEMKMIVGKPTTPTPTLSSQVNEVILYPYWMVPKSIATKELLPSIKKNPGFINSNNFQVLNGQGQVMDPWKINWQELDRTNFPYTIRQSTGCDNALGLIKLNFYSPFGVYLHDTPDKNLFTRSRRFFSHGCMRMEKPMELGHMVLEKNRVAIDTLTEKGCLFKQSPIVIPADNKMPVIVWYNPAGIDSTGNVIYYEDVYKKLTALKRDDNNLPAR